MQNRNIIILENISESTLDYRYSSKFKGAGYHRIQGGFHTAVYYLNDFSGEIVLQGTLLEYPSEADWVNIADTYVNGTNLTDTSNNFSGNFIWIRAKYQLISGNISNIIYNY
jgi:hypothetical protein